MNGCGILFRRGLVEGHGARRHAGFDTAWGPWASRRRLVLEKANLKPVAAVPIAGAIAGKDPGGGLGTGRKLGVKVSDSAKPPFRNTKADIVLHAAGSRIPKIDDQLIEIIGGGPGELRRECCLRQAGPYDDHGHPGGALHALKPI